MIYLIDNYQHKGYDQDVNVGISTIQRNLYQLHTLLHCIFQKTQFINTFMDFYSLERGHRCTYLAFYHRCQIDSLLDFAAFHCVLVVKSPYPHKINWLINRVIPHFQIPTLHILPVYPRMHTLTLSIGQQPLISHSHLPVPLPVLLMVL